MSDHDVVVTITDTVGRVTRETVKVFGSTAPDALGVALNGALRKTVETASLARTIEAQCGAKVRRVTVTDSGYFLRPNR